jgi:cytochrome c biogenesis factor
MSRPSDRPARAETERGSTTPPGRARLDALAVGAFLAGPLAFTVDLLGSYFLVPKVHASGSRAALHVVTAVALAILAAGAFAAARVLRGPAEGARRIEARVAERSRFLALGGLLLCAFFLGMVVAELIPKVLLAPGD